MEAELGGRLEVAARLQSFDRVAWISQDRRRRDPKQGQAVRTADHAGQREVAVATRLLDDGERCWRGWEPGLDQQLVRSERRFHDALKELVGLDDALASRGARDNVAPEREEHRRQL